MVKFIENSFPCLVSNYAVSYKDSDNDLVSLSSQLDLEVLQETITNKYVKVFIEDDIEQE